MMTKIYERGVPGGDWGWKFLACSICVATCPKNIFVGNLNWMHCRAIFQVSLMLCALKRQFQMQNSTLGGSKWIKRAYDHDDDKNAKVDDYVWWYMMMYDDIWRYIWWCMTMYDDVWWYINTCFHLRCNNPSRRCLWCSPPLRSWQRW